MWRNTQSWEKVGGHKRCTTSDQILMVHLLWNRKFQIILRETSLLMSWHIKGSEAGYFPGHWWWPSRGLGRCHNDNHHDIIQTLSWHVNHGEHCVLCWRRDPGLPGNQCCPTKKTLYSNSCDLIMKNPGIIEQHSQDRRKILINIDIL